MRAAPDTVEGAAEDTLVELVAHLRATAGDLLRDPATLARALDGHYRMRPHVRVIGQALAQLRPGSAQQLLITTPPQIGKSSLAARWGVFWWLARHPGHRVVITSYAASLAIGHGAAVRSLVIEHGHLYGLELDPSTGAKNEWLLTAGGGVKSVGVGGGLTGHPADLAIIDDPHSGLAEANSPRQRENVYEWYGGTLVPRLQPGSPQVLILTRWNENDLAGRLIQEQGRVEDGGAWTVLHLPALADPALTGGTDPLGREVGEPLSHPKIGTRDRVGLNEHWQRAKRRIGGRIFGALYQGDPKPIEGALIPAELLRAIRQFTGWPEPQRIAVAVDPSGGGRDVAGVVGGFRGADGRLWITHDRSLQGPSAVWSEEACRLAAGIGAGTIFVEANYGGDMAKLVLRTAWEKLQRDHDAEQVRRAAEAEESGQAFTPAPNPYEGGMPLILSVHAKAGKLLRAEPVAQQMIMDRVRLGALLPDLEAEWTTWQPDDPSSPGRIDASVHLAYGLLKIPGASEVVSVARVQRDHVPVTGLAAQRIDRGHPRP